MEKRRFFKWVGIASIVAFVLGVALAAWQSVYADTTIMSDDFSSYTNNQTITNSTFYNFANFPGEGTGNCCGNPSTKWEMDTGDFIAQINSAGVHWGHLPSSPSDGSGLYRLNTQASSSDPVITWIGKSTPVGTAADVWLRYQSQYWLYAVQYDRGDGCIVTKRKVPTNNNGQWLGPSSEIANKGVYYVLRIDSDSPSPHGSSCNQDGVDWVNIVPLATTTAIDDGTLNGGHQYTYKATAKTVPHGTGTCTGVSFDCVQIQLWRGGQLAASWTDKNDALNDTSTRTVGQDCANHYFDNVTGFQAAWCLPIYASGKSGFRNDDPMDTWITNFNMADASPSPPPPPPPPPPPVPTATISANPTSIVSGNSSLLTWSSTDATSCTASGGWSGAKGISGTQTVSPTITTTYSIACTGAGGTSPTANATVTVNPPPPPPPPPPFSSATSTVRFPSGTFRINGGTLRIFN